ncbi:MAG: hypothetical protein GXO78_13485 [Calditrichaeota bacterium]|nr:hypothetical protein [Calditrichota bacterium]
MKRLVFKSNGRKGWVRQMVSLWTIIMVGVCLLPAPGVAQNESPHSLFTIHKVVETDSAVSPTGQGGDPWFAPDKGHHFMGSLMMTVFSAQVLQRQFQMEPERSPWVGASIAFSLGLAKEFRDRRRPGNHFCWKDLLADLAGVGVALILLHQ